MVTVKIDNREISIPDGSTILEAARKLNIRIPTLCHNDSLEHYTSCMACLVKDRQTGKFLPSCASKVREGMDIESDSQDVLKIRKKSVELLLSEHRADCEAPCRLVCPAGYNIPLMNRLIMDGDLEKAAELSLRQTGSETLWCFWCQGFCMNACKRKKIDTQVAIKDLQIYVSGKNTEQFSENDKPSKPEKKDKRFNSLAGKVAEKELLEWLKECDETPATHSTVTDNNSAKEEATACMHCDCRASSDCDLRRIAEELNLKNPSGKLVNGEAVKKINRKTNLIFENAKCIKCGLCVRLCEKHTDEPALCFMNRGFVSILSEPLSYGFEEVLGSRTKEVIDICPTGALAWFKTDPTNEVSI
jgi:predicted molibdopterin-dependent oxidoreductase YjgC